MYENRLRCDRAARESSLDDYLGGRSREQCRGAPRLNLGCRLGEIERLAGRTTTYLVEVVFWECGLNKNGVDGAIEF